MQITRATDYAILSLIYLAGKGEGTVIPVREIAEHLDVSKDFLVRILDKLSVIKATRGPKGGFSLIKNPKDISFKDVIYEMEGGMGLNLCSTPPPVPCDKICKCGVLVDKWRKVQTMLETELQSIRIAHCVQDVHFINS